MVDFLQNNQKEEIKREIKVIRFWKIWLEKKKLFKNILISFLVFLNLFIWGFVIYRMSLLLIYYPKYLQMVDELSKPQINWPELKKEFSPKMIKISNPQFFYSGKLDKTHYYDLIVLAENPNSDWLVKDISYQFDFGGQFSQTIKDFILPNSKKYLLALGQGFSETARSVQVNIKDISWQRIKPSQKWRKDILKDLKIQNIDFKPAQSENDFSYLNFEAVNNSPYSFWQISFLGLLYQGNKIVGVNKITIRKFESQEIRPLTLTWKGIIPANLAKVLIDLNVFDLNNYIPLK